ncbi:MAG: PRC-barrel domain-containing protein [Deltaproteobacteria bacterium]|nr:PRC-barrel domain-containing protein [Deltaproteobacteria bacterium]
MRSARELKRYQVYDGNDRSIGYIKDFVIDTRIWRTRRVSIASTRFAQQQRLLISASDVDCFSFADRSVTIRSEPSAPWLRF